MSKVKNENFTFETSQCRYSLQLMKPVSRNLNQPETLSSRGELEHFNSSGFRLLFHSNVIYFVMLYTYLYFSDKHNEFLNKRLLKANFKQETSEEVVKRINFPSIPNQ